MPASQGASQALKHLQGVTPSLLPDSRSERDGNCKLGSQWGTGRVGTSRGGTFSCRSLGQALENNSRKNWKGFPKESPAKPVRRAGLFLALPNRLPQRCVFLGQHFPGLAMALLLGKEGSSK